ncbi:MAG: FMN-binding negative transcriptional regulator [Actinomycetota bacterium]
MYVPRHFATDGPGALRELLQLAPLAQVVSMTDDGLVATAAPLLLVERDQSIVLQGHVSRANDHWKRIDQSVDTLVIVSGPDAYVTPNNYPSKHLTHEVVPTWNYEAVHVRGPLTVHDDPAWLLDLVTRLTDEHERGRPDPWAVTDAPDHYIELRLRGIVGIEVAVDRIEAKAKLSQDKSVEDQAGVRAGLAAGSPGDRGVAERMADSPHT